MKRFAHILFITMLLTAVMHTAFAQESATMPNGASSDTPATTGKSKDAVAAKDDANRPPATDECKLCRWIDLREASLSLRYRYVDASTDVMSYNHGQQRTVLGGALKFDPAGRYSLNVRATSGYYFNWAYSGISQRMDTDDSLRRTVPGAANYFSRENTPGTVRTTVQNIIRTQYPNATPDVVAQLTATLTTQLTPQISQALYQSYADSLKNATVRSNGWNLFVRQLYFSAQPVDGVEVQYGSLPLVKGVSTEATAFDDDGYVTGGRLSIKRPKELFFDEMSVTYAYFGDIFNPNFFRRTNRVGESNYHQFLVRKKFGKRVDISTDYTFLDGSDTMREAIKVNVPEAKVIDWVRFEAYQRPSEHFYNPTYFKAGYGFALQAEKTIDDRLTLTGGVSSIDRFYTVYAPTTHYFGFTLNGDQTGIGNRVMGKVNYKLTKDLGMSVLLSQTVGKGDANAGYYWNKTHFNVAFTYDFVNLFKRTGLF